MGPSSVGAYRYSVLIDYWSEGVTPKSLSLIPERINQSGFSLFEILIALIVFSTGILTVSG
ncbi:MAG: prepilin-type N-terminal cleavage/methylation domain-containing protein [Gammaproteobacteria bacterium]|nr:prepilin-type N-terminal cleavage/methylation domain-containing protein [Gammaproteobacteria bacterium]